MRKKERDRKSLSHERRETRPKVENGETRPI